MIFSIIVTIVNLIYTIFILVSYYSWKKLKNVKANNIEVQDLSTKVTVIVAARNEEKNIERCLTSLVNQNYPAELVEIIVIDDNSADGTFELVKRVNDERVKILSLKNTGLSSKKQAITFGVEHSSGKLLMVTDADCICPSFWIREIVNLYESQKPVMIAAPLELVGKNTFDKMQSLEFMGLIGLSGASIEFKRPILCNGANLAFEKAAFEAVGGYCGNEQIASGDDMFLMIKLNKMFPGRIGFLKSQEAIVETKTCESLNQFYYQRKRWASKGMKYSDKFVTAGSLIVFLNNFLLLVTLILSFFYENLISLFILHFVIKCAVDFLFLSEISCFYNKKKLMKYFIPLAFVYMPYVSIIGISGFTGKYYWKDRWVN